ncbi:unnamed protein product, partial [Mesorhabditis belari]|uniref:LIM interaction domain-containing protein n=1 Tax=Mesorhabditis belari TaxID=2138241 RepID=A0AAF3JAN3_9BILA
MPRKKNLDGTPIPPKPRVRKKKDTQAQVTNVEPKMESVYDQQAMGMGQQMGMAPMGMGMVMEDPGMYGAPPPEYAYYGQPPAHFGSPDPSSPYVGMPTQSSTPQPPHPQAVTPNHMMMRGMPGPAPPQMPPIPAASLLEYRIHDINRRLFIFNNSGINEKDHQQWWDAFAHEFFDDDAKITFMLFDEATQKPEKFIIGRTLIPRYFRSIFESGVRELYYVLRSQSLERHTQMGPIFECENMLVVNKQDRPQSEVHTECKFTIEFSHFDEMYNYRIRHWTMEMGNTQEYLFDEQTKEYMLCPRDQEKPKSPIARCGLPVMTIHYIKLCSILEPMSLLMGYAKANVSQQPWEILRTAAFQHHTSQREREKQMAMHTQMGQPGLMAPPLEEKPKPARKRQRKPPANPKTKKGATASPVPPNNAFPQNPMQPGNFPTMGFHEVMVVGEPSMMGGDYGEEDERTISRVENTQYDPNALQMQQQSLAAQGGPPPGVMGMPGGMGVMGPGGMVHMGPPGMAGIGPSNGHPPQPQQGYDYGQWRPPSNTTMITG